MPTSQEHLAHLVDELDTLTHQSYLKRDDELVSAFGFAFHAFGVSFKEHVPSWISLDETSLAHLKAGTTDGLLDLEIISQLADLLLDEFGPTLTQDDLTHAQRLRDVCAQLRVRLNTAMQRPPDQRLPSRLDQPAIRRQLTFEFDRVLLGPISDMIATTESLLAETNLNELQRQDLETALSNCRKLYRVLLTARPLIETQNFRAMALLSHSYRSPFCGITGFFHLVLKLNNEGLNENQLNQIRDLTSYSQTVLNMLNDLVDAMKFLTNNYRDDLQASNICQSDLAVKRVMERYGHIPPWITLQHYMPDNLPTVRLNEYRLRQCLIILLDNAIKYTREGCVAITASQKGVFVVFEIRDTGIGIPVDQQQVIFEPFVQLGDQTKGLGLGLYLARQFVQRAGGTLTVESEEGVGSVFTLSVPIAQNPI